MDHLQKAKFAIDRAETVDRHERAVLKTQMAISHALIAIAEKLDIFQRPRNHVLMQHTLSRAADVSATMENDNDRAFWCGVNHALNDLWLLTTGNDPVHLPDLWARLEKTHE